MVAFTQKLHSWQLPSALRSGHFKVQVPSHPASRDDLWSAGQLSMGSFKARKVLIPPILRVNVQYSESPAQPHANVVFVGRPTSLGLMLLPPSLHRGLPRRFRVMTLRACVVRAGATTVRRWSAERYESRRERCERGIRLQRQRSRGTCRVRRVSSPCGSVGGPPSPAGRAVLLFRHRSPSNGASSRSIELTVSVKVCQVGDSRPTSGSRLHPQ